MSAKGSGERMDGHNIGMESGGQEAVHESERGPEQGRLFDVSGVFREAGKDRRARG